ncbi:hypothetical protein [Muricoccus radiodurans]|uniref:hypothetical protein n=1 Tax=Muricoccus radiodurans TaxID=2231721 RepID=UPI003CF8E29D
MDVRSQARQAYCQLFSDGGLRLVVFRSGQVPSDDSISMPMEDLAADVQTDIVMDQWDDVLVLLSGEYLRAIDGRLSPTPGPAHAVGRSLWQLHWDELGPHYQQPHRQQSVVVPLPEIEAFERDLTTLLAERQLVLAGKRIPFDPTAPYVPIDPMSLTLWRLAIVSDRAIPREPGRTVELIDLRVFTSEEWQRLRDPATVQSAGHSQKPRAPGGAPDGYPWDDFIREIVRLTWEGGFSDQKALRKHMREWCDREWGGRENGAPDDKTIKRRVERYCPPDIPLQVD